MEKQELIKKLNSFFFSWKARAIYVFGSYVTNQQFRDIDPGILVRNEPENLLEYELKTILPEDLIGLKVQAISNDPGNRFPVDAPDIQRILQIKIDELDMELVRMYFELFSKEELLDEWLDEINRWRKIWNDRRRKKCARE